MIDDMPLPEFNTIHAAIGPTRSGYRRKILAARELRRHCQSPSDTGTHFALIHCIESRQINRNLQEQT
jgi:hypothetical protein